MDEFKQNDQQSDNDVVVGSGGSDRLTKKVYSVFLIFLFLLAGSITYLVTKTNTPSTQNTTNTNSTASVESAYATKVSPALVNITSTGFSPSSITIQKGQAVVWINKDSAPHQPASDPYPTDITLPDFNSRVGLKTNDSYTYIFSAAGTYTYHDNLNPTILGTVQVNR